MIMWVGGAPTQNIVRASPPARHIHTQRAQKLIFSYEGCKILLIMMLFQDLNSKLVHGIIKTYFLP